ncbi:hypothetical protein P3T76_013507 [Phytophthora citrophthora]|uniref:Uncharacterized protein n=1 Tax=Phytophthora citrophthora TaxID=4793 RepID=A0AAD9G2X2_9STRA|nr:hypothetical protein P3T76_013507 [Phytophthora citrophthora]
MQDAQAEANEEVSSSSDCVLGGLTPGLLSSSRCGWQVALCLDIQIALRGVQIADDDLNTP